MYIALSLLQKWNIKLKEKDQNQVCKMKETIARWLKDFKPRSAASDVVEI